MVADGAREAATAVYSDHLHGYIWPLLPSPDGSSVAFGRSFLWADKAGVWLLNVKTRLCEEVTFEKAKTYMHQPLVWESPSNLLFSRKRGGTWGIYRAQGNVGGRGPFRGRGHAVQPGAPPPPHGQRGIGGFGSSVPKKSTAGHGGEKRVGVPNAFRDRQPEAAFWCRRPRNYRPRIREEGRRWPTRRPRPAR